jgi:hypothetical protein
MRFMTLLFGEKNRSMVARLNHGRDVPVQIQGWRRGGGPKGLWVWAGDSDRWVDVSGYVPVISRINVEKVGHAI